MFKKLEDLFNKDSEDGISHDFNETALAVCIILLEAAKIDGEFSDDEYDGIIDTLTIYFKLSQNEAAKLVDLASNVRENTLDIFPFTRQVNEQFSREEKIEILEEIWRIIFADGHLDAHEDYLVHKLARLFNLRHSELIEAKLTARDEMEEE